MPNRYDIAIVGAGNAGFGVSEVAHAAGKSIAFIEPDLFGGTCPNRGCTPKKILVAAAMALDEIERAPAHGIEVGAARLDWTRLIERKREMIADLPKNLEATARERGDVYRGVARFVGVHTLEVDGERIEADNIVIATGSKTRPLPISGAELMITSDEVLSERKRPDEVVFVGGGVIAMEFSHVYARAGSKVTILEVAPRLLGNLDADAVAALRKESERIGIRILTEVDVQAIEEDGERLRIRFEHDGKEQTLGADRIVNGAGRIANVEDLDPEAGGIEHDGIRIAVDDYLRSKSNPSVWVAGDALLHSAQLSPLATYEGKVVAHSIVSGEPRKPDYSVVPSAVYTIPALASVGLTEAEAKAEGIDFDAIESDMSDWFSTLTQAESIAYAKILVERGSRRIVGAHLLGHHGSDLIHLFALAMRHDISADAVADQLYAFPTFAADIPSML